MLQRYMSTIHYAKICRDTCVRIVLNILRTIPQILIFNRYTNISAAHWLITV